MPDDEQPPSDDDKFRPDAIAARVDKLGTESETDRVAREEEQKLLQRKKDRKKGGGGGLESAASKRLARIGEGKVKRPSAAVEAMGGDPLLDRFAGLQKWLKKNQGTAIAVAGLAVIAGGVGIGVEYWRDRRDAQASVLLAQAMADEHGHIASEKADSDEEASSRGLYPTFKSVAARRDAALAKYRTLESKFAGTGAAILARLEEGAILLDLEDAKGALAAYDDVRQSPLAQADAEVRGRALEGKGFAHELLARSDAAGSEKHLDEALTDFKAVEAVDVDGFKELGMYHQARVLVSKGDRAKAIEILKELQKRVSEPNASGSYLQIVVEDRLRELDPTALPPKGAKGMGGPGGANALDALGLGGGGGPGGGSTHIDMNDPKIQELLRQLKERGSAPGAPAVPGAPAAPGAPPAPAQSPSP